ncbi:related to SFH1 subunit of the RSC complex [Cephalotrichum gorgonifer]|uniref:Related to SFH1 subunit of the RSC complex n=1 Tax=Cephalotrichum gorgonifer TaxID=2041049 RepID=A0AAE8N2E6_9PEZI|nr:related to SFH1 subunit of the RSC complex [Cephalotrichum gorgonifer]
MDEAPRPQASLTTLAPRLRIYQNSLLTPVLQTAQANPISRLTKRGTTIINYAEDGYDDLEDDDSDTRRRPSGLRNLKKDESTPRPDMADRVGKETTGPVTVTGQWREWMARAKMLRSNQQAAAQANLPLTLIPIRIDLDVPAFAPQSPFPVAPGAHYDPSLPQFRPQEVTTPYRLRDFFLWNLHESMITTDQFALTLVQDLDLPNPRGLAAEISKQIRTQLEEYAGVALHPLFHSIPQGSNAPRPNPDNNTPTPTPAVGQSRADTPLQNGLSTPRPAISRAPEVTAEATAIAPGSEDFNPDDTYRCVVRITLNLANTLYTDKFEWSLLHPPGTAEAFAKQTCADLGLAGEWVPALTHAIYEAVLRLKKEACESGGVVVGGGGGLRDVANDAAQGAEAGWRYEPESLAEEWEPKIEVLTKEEMERREGDRERQIRRLRRETARFSSTSGLVGGVPFSGFGTMVEAEEERMGRGERNRRKKRLRSLSPAGRSGTPGGRGTPDAGYGGGGALADVEREQWRCVHCGVRGTSVWAVRDGPAGPRTLCNNCGYLYERDRGLPRLMKNLHYADQRVL